LDMRTELANVFEGDWLMEKAHCWFTY
jgi:hypothetical protein